MNRFCQFSICALLLAGCAGNLTPYSYVDPMIGTGFHAHTYPGAAMPYGMVQLSPDTRVGGWDACSGYHHSDSTILGFSHTHLSGTGCADLSDILFYPSVEELNLYEGLYVCPAHRFSHSDEVAKPGYYSVVMDSGTIEAELTAALRTGVHRYRFNAGDVRMILIDLGHSVSEEEKVIESAFYEVSSDEICGYRVTDAFVTGHHIYFSARFSEPFSVEIIGGKQALLSFAPDVEELTAAVSLSSVSCNNAAENGLAEVPVLDFDKVREQAYSAWTDELDDMIVKGGSTEDRVNFYTSVYHSKLCPNIMNDVNGEYRRHDDTIGTVPQGRSYYSTLSLWDTFRAWNPLQTVIDTELVEDIIFSMLEMYRCTGELPLWPLASGETNCMVGYHSLSVIADAYMKGIRNFDAEYALEAMIRSSNVNKKGSEFYLEYDYIPSDKAKESVSQTLEFAYDDWTLARMAEALGKDEIANEYYRRAANYINIFDSNTLFFRGRNADGSWMAPFDINIPNRDFTEGTPWHYRFFVPHDINGLQQCFGSQKAFIKALDDLFTLEATEDVGISDVTGFLGQYAHGNEPSHHMAYLYSYVGQPWKTQYYTRELLDVMYEATPEGIIGNEDAGQMSAWYILSSLGFYPVCPGSNEFVLTAPLFEEAVVKLANGNILTVKADNPSRSRYVKSVSLNGLEIDSNYLTYDQLMNGGELVFELDRKPDYDRGVTPDTFPYSMTSGEVVAAPYTAAGTILFEGEVPVDLATVTQGAIIRYTVDGTEPSESSRLYEAPVILTESGVLKAKAFKEGLSPSKTTVINAVKAEMMPPVKVKPSLNGVNYRYYEGNITHTSQIGQAALVSEGVLPEPSLDFVTIEDHYGIVFNGYIDVPQTGVWEFATTTDDGSVLYIDNMKVVDNDGGHSAITAVGKVALEKGMHSFRFLYFEDYEGQELGWSWKAPGADVLTPIPVDVLYLNN